jgi:hypothetical protein
VAWRVASSLNRLLVQINDLAPNRSLLSDGGVADDRHPTTSDHSPRSFSWANQPLVLARDFTHDVRGGLDCNRLRDALVLSRDPRIAYVIWDGLITAGANGPTPWRARTYKGANRHDKHLHISVVRDARADSAVPWNLRWPALPSPAPRRPTLRRGDSGDAVKLLQRFLGVVEADEPGYGVFGDRTHAAVLRYQRLRGLEQDGVVGPKTWAEIEKGLAAPPSR